MARGGWRRKWIKLYPVDCIDGSIRYQLKPDERSVWYDLLNFSAICSTPGVISDKDGRPYPVDFIANRLNITTELLGRALKKCKDEGRITEKDGVFIITNWEAYQSEYDRQKQYRQKPDGSEPAPDENPNIFNVYENEIGALTPIVSYQLKDLEGRYPADDIKDAIREAALNNVRKLKYVEAILENWARSGKSTGGQKAPPPWMTEGLEE